MAGFLERIGRQRDTPALSPVQQGPVHGHAIGPQSTKSGTNNAHFIRSIARTRGGWQNGNRAVCGRGHIDQRAQCLAGAYLNHDAVFSCEGRCNRIGKAHRVAQMAHPIIGRDNIIALRPIAAQRRYHRHRQLAEPHPVKAGTEAVQLAVKLARMGRHINMNPPCRMISVCQPRLQRLDLGQRA